MKRLLALGFSTLLCGISASADVSPEYNPFIKNNIAERVSLLGSCRIHNELAYLIAQKKDGEFELLRSDWNGTTRSILKKNGNTFRQSPVNENSTRNNPLLCAKVDDNGVRIIVGVAQGSAYSAHIVHTTSGNIEDSLTASQLGGRDSAIFTRQDSSGKIYFIRFRRRGSGTPNGDVVEETYRVDNPNGPAKFTFVANTLIKAGVATAEAHPYHKAYSTSRTLTGANPQRLQMAVHHERLKRGSSYPSPGGGEVMAYIQNKWVTPFNFQDVSGKAKESGDVYAEITSDGYFDAYAAIHTDYGKLNIMKQRFNAAGQKLSSWPQSVTITGVAYDESYHPEIMGVGEHILVFFMDKDGLGKERIFMAMHSKEDGTRSTSIVPVFHTDAVEKRIVGISLEKTIQGRKLYKLAICGTHDAQDPLYPNDSIVSCRYADNFS